jgi:hypothetical protein
MKNKKDQEKFSLKDQLNLIQIDISQSELMKTSNSINQSPNNNSKPKSAESEDIDFIEFYSILLNSQFSNFYFASCSSLSIFLIFGFCLLQ